MVVAVEVVVVVVVVAEGAWKERQGCKAKPGRTQINTKRKIKAGGRGGRKEGRGRMRLLSIVRLGTVANHISNDTLRNRNRNKRRFI